MKDLDEKWTTWLADTGNRLAEEVEEQFLKNRHIFEMEDGTHAKWVKSKDYEEERLGVLLIFNLEELSELCCAWEDAQDGNMMAGSFVAGWLGQFMAFVDRAADASG